MEDKTKKEFIKTGPNSDPYDVWTVDAIMWVNGCGRLEAEMARRDSLRGLGVSV